MRNTWTRLVLALAGLHVLVGLASVAVAVWTGQPLGTVNPTWVFPLQLLVFGGAAAFLYAAGARGDPRVADLSCVFAVIAAAFARAPEAFLHTHAGGATAVALLGGLRLEAFLPLFVWRFFREFPRSVDTPRVRRLADGAVAVAGAGGVALLVANLALALGGPRPALAPFDANSFSSSFWIFSLGLTSLAFPFAALRARFAPVEERRRVALFATAIGATAALYFPVILAPVLYPPALAWVRGDGRDVVLPFFQILILSIPLTTAYSVLVDRVLPVRAILRQALRYTLARGLVTVAAALPLVWLAWYLYPLRGEPISSVLSGTRSLAVVGVGLLGVGTLRLRRRARNAIDRTFFRDQYDARRMLLSVAERSRQVSRASDLAELLAGELDRALHLESIAVLLADPLSGDLRAFHGSLRSLPIESELARRLARAAAPVDAELEGLPEDDQYWLADAAAQLLVPLVSSANELIGLLALGGKRSELPFNGEDRQLLAAIGAAGAVTLESRLKLGTGIGRGAVAAEAAQEPATAASACPGCGRVSSQAERCPECGGAVEPIPLPAVLHGKFELERRVGEGGMGVVYLARDLDLGRSVALKTLPRTAPEEAARLRREARAMAAVLHPNLAVIYAAETWKGTPILVTEFLDGGTLEERIRGRRLPLAETRELGARISAGLGRVHRAGILHRDVKPSNIGFTEDGVPKLLDFGLARVVGDGGDRSRKVSAADLPGTVSSDVTLTDHGIVGTPLYMSPEAIRGDAPDASFDLWALAAVLYEAMAGVNPVERPSWGATLRAIQDAEVPDIRVHAPEASAALAGFFVEALHRELPQRPSSADEFRERWERAATA